MLPSARMGAKHSSFCSRETTLNQPKSHPLRVISRIVLVIAVLIALIVIVIQQFEQLSSTAACESEGICSVTVSSRDYATAHQDDLPTRAQLMEWLRKQQNHSRGPQEFDCNKGPFVFARVQKTTSPTDAVPYVWCAAPHGFYHRWRNVLFSDLMVRHVPEGDFQKIQHSGRALPSQVYSVFCIPTPYRGRGGIKEKPEQNPGN
jgi:hypothetical protein